MIRINLILHSFVKWSVTLVIKMHDVDNVNQLIPQNFIEVDPTKASIFPFSIMILTVEGLINTLAVWISNLRREMPCR